MIRYRIFRGFGANALNQGVNIALQIVLVPIMAINWGLDQYGLWLMIYTIPSYLSMSDIGFGTAANNKMIIVAASGDMRSSLITYQTAWCFVSGAGLFLAIFLVLATVAIPDSTLLRAEISSVEELRAAVAVLILYSLISLQAKFLQAPFQATGRYATGVMMQTAASLTEGAALIASVMHSDSILIAATSLFVAKITSLILSAIFVSAKVPAYRLGFQHFNMTELRSLISPAAALAVIPVGQSLFLQGTTLAVGFAISPAAVPAFAAVRTLTRVAVQFISLLNHAVMPEMSAAVGRGDAQAQRSYVGITLSTGILVGVAAAPIMSALGPTFVSVWSGYTINVPYLHVAIMAAAMALYVVWHPLSNLLLAANRHAMYSYALLFLSAAAVALSFPLSHMFGLAGGAAAIFLLDAVMVVLLLYQTKRIMLRGESISPLIAAHVRLLANAAYRFIERKKRQ